MLPIAGFCPRFAAECTYKVRPERRTHPLDMLQHAFHHQGLLGVKLYPVMGFQAWENKNLDTMPTDGNFTNTHGYVLRDQNGGPVPLGRAMDAELENLYSFCVANELPIMAHTCPTHGSHSGYALRADPCWWEKVLTQRRFRNLRINMAHFGGWSPDTVLSRLFHSSKTVKREWGERIAAIISQHQHAYTDIGDAEEINGKKWEDAFAAALKNWTGKARLRTGGFGPHIPGRKMLYGSDWFVMEQADLFAHDDDSFLKDDNGRLGRTYAPRWADFMKRNKVPVDDFMGHNALRWLGLDKAKTRDRIDGFLDEHDIPRPQWRQKLQHLVDSHVL
jgi:predicted TIM-barrel fold metal-dependent hydrolase